MAERPDLEYWVPILRRELAGRLITGAAVQKPVVLRQAIPGDLVDALTGQALQEVVRHGRFVHMSLSKMDIVVSPMLAGRFEISDADSRARKDVALAIGLDDGRVLRYRDSVQMGKVYALPKAAFGHVPGYSNVGVDVLDEAAFTLERFVELSSQRRDQVRVFLMDKGAIDFLGNAYADEVLFAAGIHPKTWVRSLDKAALERLHESIVAVTKDATCQIRDRQPPLDVKLRDFLKVRRKHKEPCPNCETPIRKAGVRGFDAFFCPRCQAETRKSSIVSW